MTQINGLGHTPTWPPFNTNFNSFDQVLFVLGAGLASLSWQTALAAFGALARRSLPPSWQFALSLFGNLLVAGLGIGMLVG